MGKVVDEKLRVIGIGGLRVVDASVMPAVPSGNINAAVIAVAEKGADLVRGRLPIIGRCGKAFALVVIVARRFALGRQPEGARARGEGRALGLRALSAAVPR